MHLFRIAKPSEDRLPILVVTPTQTVFIVWDSVSTAVYLMGDPSEFINMNPAAVVVVCKPFFSILLIRNSILR